MIEEKGVRRLERVEKEVTKLVSEYAMRNLVKDGVLYTVTSTKISHDLKYATVRVSALGLGDDQELQKQKSLDAFQDARFEIQSFLGKNLRTKFSPKITFELDEYTDRQLKVQKLIAQVSSEVIR